LGGFFKPNLVGNSREGKKKFPSLRERRKGTGRNFGKGPWLRENLYLGRVGVIYLPLFKPLKFFFTGSPKRGSLGKGPFGGKGSEKKVVIWEGKHGFGKGAFSKKGRLN